jgi:hypothetical protein
VCGHRAKLLGGRLPGERLPVRSSYRKLSRALKTNGADTSSLYRCWYCHRLDQ